QTMKTGPPKPPSDREIQEAEEFRKMMGPPRIEPPFGRLPPPVQRLQLWAQSHRKLSGASENFMGEEFQAMYEARAKTKYPLGYMPLISLRAGSEDWTP